MKIVVLAAGEGKRMWPLQIDKCLLPFLGQPLLFHNLKQLKENCEAAEFVIITNPQSREKISKIAQDLDLNFQIAVQSKSTGMADAILSAKNLIEGEILIINAEDQLDSNIYQGVLGTKGAEVVVVGLKSDKYFPGGYLKVNEDNVVGLVEKPGEGNVGSDLIKLVVDYFKDGKKFLEYLKKAETAKDDQYEVALDQMIKDGVKVKLFLYKGIWIPLKFPWHVLDVTKHLLSQIEQQISSAATISDKATIEGNVVIEAGVRVFEGAVIKGPCYIAKDCIIGNNSMVRESDLEEGCITGFNSDITRSYIGPNSWFHTNYVGDSVIEGDFGMGSGAVLANLRLDDHIIRVGTQKIDSGRRKLGLMVGLGTRIGANASTMPGVRIGANSLVGPGVILQEDVKENTKVVMKQEYQISEYLPKLTNYDQFRDKLR